MAYNPYQSFNDVPANDPNQGNQGGIRPDRYFATGRNDGSTDGTAGSHAGPGGNDMTPWQRELAEQTGPSFVRTTRSANGDVTINEYFIKNAQFVQRDGDQGTDYRFTPPFLRPSQRGDFRAVDRQFLAEQDRARDNYYRASYMPPPDAAWGEQRRRHESAYERWEDQQRRQHSWNPNYNQGSYNTFASNYNPYAYAGGYDSGININAGRGFGISIGNGGISFRIGGGNHHSDYRRNPYSVF